MQPSEQQNPIKASSEMFQQPSAADQSGSAPQEVPYTSSPEESVHDLPATEPVQWQAIEYIQHSKQPIWYVGFAVVVVILMALAILLIHSWTFTILIPVMAVALMVYSHRPPRELSYVLSEKGLFINDQLHPLGEFKSFGVIKDVQLHALMLIPTKRFRPGLMVYFPTEVGEQIVDLLGERLPMEEIHPDAFDRIVHALRL